MPDARSQHAQIISPSLLHLTPAPFHRQLNPPSPSPSHSLYPLSSFLFLLPLALLHLVVGKEVLGSAVPGRAEFSVLLHHYRLHCQSAPPPLHNPWSLLVTCSATPQLFQQSFVSLSDHSTNFHIAIGHSRKAVAPSFNSPLRHNRSWPFKLPNEATTTSTQVGSLPYFSVLPVCFH